MFKKSQTIYDTLYAWKDYAREAVVVSELIQRYKTTPSRQLLDVACGTAVHLEHLKDHHVCYGLDVEEEMVHLSRERNPDVEFFVGDMADFRLEQRFGAVVCLFSSIGYMKSVKRLNAALARMSSHLEPGGVLIVEPWLHPNSYEEGNLHAGFVDQPDLKVTRMNVSRIEDKVSILEFHYLVGRDSKIEYFTERHELGLFTNEEYHDAFSAAGVGIVEHSFELSDRGVYVGVKR